MIEPTVAERAALARAVALAAATRPTASPNPTVGCVVLADGGPVASGASAPVGGPHAEVVALGRAGARAHGSTVVVTLEPCRHHGRTPPCTEAIAAAGVARVVIGRGDRNALAAGGAARLSSVGVEVAGPLADDDVLARAIDAELAGPRTTHVRDRPAVTLKLAQRPDGGLVAPAGGRWISGAAARRAVHRDRVRSDAVLVGIGTVHADDPVLDARDAGIAGAPRAVVLDTAARTPVGARVVRPGTIVLVAPDAPAAAVAGLIDRGVRVRAVPRGPGGLDLAAALSALVEEGVTTVLAEPGPTLASALVAGGHVDRVVLHIAADPELVERPHAAIDLVGWRIVRRGGAGPDRIVELVPDERDELGRATTEEAA